MESVVRMADDPLILKLKNEASDLLAQRARLSQLYREKHPDLVVLDASGRIRDVMVRGQWHVRNGHAIRRGTFEGLAT